MTGLINYSTIIFVVSQCLVIVSRDLSWCTVPCFALLSITFWFHAVLCVISLVIEMVTSLTYSLV